MRILHTENSCGWGGQEIRILSEATGMMARGHLVHLVCPREARIYPEAMARGLPVTALPIGRKNPRGLFALRNWLRANPMDVINTHSSTDSWLAALACASLGRRPPIVRTRHISAPVPRNTATRWLYGQAARIVTTGEKLKSDLVATLGCDPARIVSIPTGIDTEVYRPPGPEGRAEARRGLGLPADAFVFGIVATLRSWKGHADLLEAFARLQDPSALLLLVGGGPQQENLERRIAELGLAGRALMPGNQAEVLPWLHALDVFALPSYANEGVPQALMQAMLTGLPAVTTDIGGIPEVAMDGETALVVPPRDVAALSAALARLRADDALRARLGEAARRHVAARHSRSLMLERMEDVFREAVAGRPTR